MRLAPLLALAALLAATPARSAEDACPILAEQGGPAAVTGAAPRAGSAEAEADRAIVLWEQRTRTPDDVARAVSEEKLSLEDFAGVLGPGFDPARHPLTEALLERAVAVVRPCVSAAKAASARPRPYVADPSLSLAVTREPSSSFPSGHATRGALLAAVLAELAPARREALLRRGAQIGEDRVIAGVHYPSDVAAGQRLAGAVARGLLADPGFAAALADVRGREWAPAAATDRRSVSAGSPAAPAAP